MKEKKKKKLCEESDGFQNRVLPGGDLDDRQIFGFHFILHLTDSIVHPKAVFIIHTFSLSWEILGPIKSHENRKGVFL